MSGINKVIIIGRLGADPEMKTIPNGNTVTTLSVATSENWVDKLVRDGNRPRPDDQKVDWSRPAREVDCHIRGLSPFPGAWCYWTPPGKDDPVRLKLLMCRRSGRETTAPAGMVLDDRLLVACGDGGAVRILRLQKPGGKPMNADQFLQGQAIAPDTVLG